MKRVSLVAIILCGFLLKVSAQDNQTFPPTMDNLLSLTWTIKGQEYPSKPLVHNGLVFESYGLEYTLKAKTGEKLYFHHPEHQQIIRSLSPDSLVFFSSRKGVTVINIYSGQRVYSDNNKIRSPWIEKPRIVKGNILYTASNDTSFVAYDLLNKKNVWQKRFNARIFNSCIINQQTLYITDEQYLYALDKETGKEIWKHDLGELISEPYLTGDIFYGWVKNKGLIAFDTRKKKINWAFNDTDRRQMYFEFIICSDTIFVNPFNLYALSISDGQILWKNDNLRSSLSFYLGSTDNHILTYQTLDDDVILTATDKKTGKIMYESFKGYDLGERPLSHLEHARFRFADTMYENLLIGMDVQGNIYCFAVKE